MPVVINLEVSSPDIFFMERNSIIPANIMFVPIPSMIAPPVKAIVSFIGNGQVA
jgi:hypothetical protein